MCELDLLTDPFQLPGQPFNWFYPSFYTADPDLKAKIQLHSAAVCISGPCIPVYNT